MQEGILSDFPISHIIIKSRLFFRRSFDEETRIRILPDGTGWVLLSNESYPAVFYMEDILYRLDLQNKSK